MTRQSMNTPEIQLLLATYNGQSYLPALLDSLCEQSFTEFEVLVSDDGSTDSTLSILASFSEKLNIRLLPSEGNHGSSGNFYRLIKASTAQYVMFCDQDDVWLSGKIADSLLEIKKLDAAKPALCFGDIQVVNEELKVLAPSFLSSQKLNKDWAKIPYYTLVQSLAAGCSQIFNRSLINTIREFPPSWLFLHDHLILLHAGWYGNIGFIDKPLVLYRQHGKNAIGAHRVNVSYFIAKLQELRSVFKRWFWLREHLSPKPSLLKMAITKLYISLSRISEK